MTDLDLLKIQAGMSLDARGRYAGLFGVTIAVAPQGEAIWIGAAVPDDLAAGLTAIVVPSPRSIDPSNPPPALDAGERAIEAAMGVRTARHAGPSYVFPPHVRFDSSVEIVRSGTQVTPDLRLANPGNWPPIEWDELLDGRLGPWAMVVSSGEVLSICHTPLPTTGAAAECGVWTRPDARGRGLAAATASAWAEVLAPTGRHLFYHHDADNLSSQRVAQRLRLRPIGWIWRVAVDEHAGGAHPLSSESATHRAT